MEENDDEIQNTYNQPLRKREEQPRRDPSYESLLPTTYSFETTNSDKTSYDRQLETSFSGDNLYEDISNHYDVLQGKRILYPNRNYYTQEPSIHGDNQSYYSYDVETIDTTNGNQSIIGEEFETASFLEKYFMEDEAKKRQRIERQKKLVVVAILKALSRYGCTTHRIEYLVHRVSYIKKKKIYFNLNIYLYKNILTGCRRSRYKMSCYSTPQYVHVDVW